MGAPRPADRNERIVDRLMILSWIATPIECVRARSEQRLQVKC